MGASIIYIHKSEISQFNSGKEEAFTAVYNLFYDRVYLYAKRFLPTTDDAEDATADTFVQLWKKRNALSTVDAISAFLHVTVRNKCIDILRRSKARTSRNQQSAELLQQNEASGFSIEQVRIELMELIYSQVDKLPPRMKEIFLMAFKEGVTTTQIAKRLHIAEQTVSNQKASALKLLKEVLARQPILIALLVILENQ